MALQSETTDALAQIARLIQDAQERCARGHGVSPILARLLDALSDRAPTVNELAELLALDKSSTSGLVDRAQRRGLVRRVSSQIDRRAVRVRLTADGRELARQLRAEIATDLTALLDPLSPTDSRALTDALSRILATHTPR